MTFEEARAKMNPFARRPGFTEVDVLIGTDASGQKICGVRCKYRGIPFEWHLPLAGRDPDDSLVFEKMVDDFNAPLEAWEVRLSNANAQGFGRKRKPLLIH